MRVLKIAVPGRPILYRLRLSRPRHRASRCRSRRVTIARCAVSNLSAGSSGAAFMKPSLEDTLLASIRTIPDYPKPGILFRDITTLLGNARAFRRAIDELVHPYAGQKI